MGVPNQPLLKPYYYPMWEFQSVMCQVWVLEQQMGQTENLLKSCLCGKFVKSKCSYIM